MGLTAREFFTWGHHMSRPAAHCTVGLTDRRHRHRPASRVGLIGLLFLALLAGSSAFVFAGNEAALAASPRVGKSPLPHTAARVIVKYHLSESLSGARASAREVGATVVGRVRTYGLKTSGRYLVVSSSTLNTAELIKEFRADPAVEYVEPDYVVKADAAVTPNDLFMSSLWGLTKIDAPSAWGVSTGAASVVVADIDTGVDYAHPDLAANMWRNPGEIAGNGIDDDGNGYVDDVYGIDAAYGSSDPWDPDGHGTHTAGTMAAVGNNGIGVAGVCWSASIMALEFMDNSGVGNVSDAITCINYMTWEKVHYGVNVVAANCSWGGGNYSQTLHDAIAAAGDAGIVFVCAAGNEDSNNDALPSYPASYDCSNIISVAATDSDDSLASFSNWGSSSVDLAAPGVGILSTFPTDIDSFGYRYDDGTSMATPFVTGAVALRAAAYPNESMAERIAAILGSVDTVGSLAGKVSSGGRLNLARALAPSPEADTVGPVCAAKNVTVRPGRACRIYFKVHDGLSAKVTTKLVITTRSGAVKKRWSWGYDQNYAGWWWIKYVCRLKRGTYRIVITGKDLTGNPASVVGRAKLVVK
jgi:subtilisin family serine protease